MSALANALRALAIRSPRFEGLYRRIGRPDHVQWADMLRSRGDFHAMGEHCSVDPHALIEGRHLIRLGANVRLAKCAIFCYEGAVPMINRAYGLKLDGVGKVDIRDNVFIGFGAIVLPGVTIGPNAIVAAGSLVRADVAEGDVVCGVPAMRAGRLDISVAMLKAKNLGYPWRSLIEQRAVEWDEALEPELARLRAEFFFGKKD